MTMNHSRQPFVLVNVYSGMNQDKRDALPTVIAGWKNVAIDACDFVRLCVVLIVNNTIDSRLLAPFSRLEFFSCFRGHNYPFYLNAPVGKQTSLPTRAPERTVPQNMDISVSLPEISVPASTR